MLGFARILILGGGVVAGDSSLGSAVIAPHETGVASETVPDATRPILLLHGFCSSARVMVPLGRQLERALGRKVVLVRNHGRDCDLRERARQVDRLLARLATAPGFDYADVVGHSMGGLVATYLLKRIDGGCRVRKVLTLGTPHRGAPRARLFSMLIGGLSRVLSQMTPRSGFVEELKWTPVPSGCQLVSIAGQRDRVVPPPSTRLAMLPGHRNLCIPDTSHLGLICSRSVWRVVCGTLAGEPEHTELEVLAA